MRAIAQITARGRRRIEIAALALLAMIPALPYGAHLITHRVPRFSMFGDYAVLERVARYVWSGRTVLGPYSRFGFSHPGPLYFYVLAPVFLFFPRSSEGLFVGALLLNVTAAVTLVVAARVFGSRAHAIAALLALLAWFVAFGNIVTNPWNPLVIVLSLDAYLVLAAFFALGATSAACPAALLGALVAQSHVGAVITVVGIGTVTTAMFVVRRRGRLERRERTHLVFAAVLLVVAWLPPLFEELTVPDGNLTKIATFFMHRPEPLKPFSTAVRNWALATSWLPDRLVDMTLLTDTGVPLPMRWDPVPTTLSRTAQTMAWLHVFLVAGAALLARRRRDTKSLALLAVGASVELMAIPALRAIVGADFYYLLFWVTSGSFVAWIGVLATLIGSLGSAYERFERPAYRGALVLVGVAGLLTAALQRSSIAHTAESTALPLESYPLRDVYGLLVNALRTEHASAIVHLDHGAWPLGTVLFLELVRDGIPAYVDDRDAYVFGRPPPARDAVNPRHVYIADESNPLPPAACLERIGTSGSLAVSLSREDLDRCGTPR